MGYKPQPTRTSIDTPAGWCRLGTLVSIDQSTMTAKVRVRQSNIGSGQSITASLPLSFVSSAGAFIGGYVSPGTAVVIAEAEASGIYYIVAFLARDPSALNTTGIASLNIPTFKEGQIIIQANPYVSITLEDEGITMGEPDNFIELDVDRNIYFNTFDSLYTLSQGTREVIGAIKRDVKPASHFSTTLRLNSTNFDDTLKVIGMDPLSPARNSNAGFSIRNPSRIEHRELVLEYDDAANVQSNDIEIKNYTAGSNQPIIDFNFINRRQSRADTLSLSSVAPNYLIETTKGTVVDIFGNLLDLNRNIIPIGQNKIGAADIKTTISTSDIFQNAYQQIKREERKSIAFHFELNARKEEGVAAPVNVNDQTDYARSRSRFSLDIDKEGQLKLNVPASSEYGNIPLLTRYENYSTVYPNTKTNDPNTLMFDATTGGAISRDILIDSFINTQVVSLVDTLNTNAAPIDRFSPPGQSNYLKHGTVYHDISSTCISSQSPQYSVPEYIPTTRLGLGEIPPINNVVSPSVVVSGMNANAGGRSASLNFDGMVELNVGANTVDRQSLWADYEGGIVMNVGKDLPNNASLLANLDGQVLIEIGGFTSPQDTRYPANTLTQVAGALDIRVWNGAGECCILRIDQGGLQITTPSQISLYSNAGIDLVTEGTMTIDAAELNVQGRIVQRNGTPI